MNQPASPQAQASGQVRPFASHLPALLFLTGIFLTNFLARITLAPLLAQVEADLGLDHAQAGGLFFLITLGYFPGLVGVGFISSRLDHRRVIIISALAVGGSLILLSLAQGLTQVRLGLFLLGLASGLYLPSGFATLTSMVKAEHWGKALAVHELAPNLSFVLAPLLAGVFLNWGSWRGAMGALGIISLGLGFCFWRWGEGGLGKGQAPSLSSLRSLMTTPSFWIMMALFSLGIGGTLGVYTMLPLFLVTERGMEAADANLLLSASRLTGVGMAFVSGMAVDRLGPVKSLWVVMGLSGVLTMALGALPQAGLTALLFLQPLVAVCFFPAGFACLARVGAASAGGLAVSFTMPIAYVVGGGGLPTLIGFLGQTFSFAWGLGVAGALIFSTMLLLPGLKLRGAAEGSRN